MKSDKTKRLLEIAKSKCHLNASAEIEARHALEELIGLEVEHVCGFRGIVKNYALPIGDGHISIEPLPGEHLGQYSGGLRNGQLLTDLRMVYPVKKKGEVGG